MKSGIAKRNQVWYHNGLRGSAALMKANLEKMLKAETVTDEARQQIKWMQPYVDDLIEMLKERKETT